MAIIPTVGRSDWKLRLLIVLLYLGLSLGAVTMVYPFMLMIGTSMTSDTDYTEFRPIPRYLYDKGALFSKEVEIRYGADMVKINSVYGTDFANLQGVTPPEVAPASPAVFSVTNIWNGSVNYFEGQLRGMQTVQMPCVSTADPRSRAQVQDWQRFQQSLPPEYFQAAYAGRAVAPSSAPSRLLERYRKWLELKYVKIDRLNKAYTEENDTFANVMYPMERPTSREWSPDSSRFVREWLQFRQQLPPRFRMVVGVDPLWQTFLQQNKYDSKIEALNAAWGTQYGFFSQITLPEKMPAQPAVRKDWEEFVRNQLPFRYMKVDPSAVSAWRGYLQLRYGRLDLLREKHHAAYASFASVPLPRPLPSEGQVLTDWMEFIAKVAPISALHPDTAENRYRRQLLSQYGSLEAINQRYGTRCATLQSIRPPLMLEDWSYVSQNASSLRRYFAGSNFRMVWDYIGRHGHGVTNTFIYVVLAITTNLLVNPLCAYALSRYNLRYAHRVLLFLLATMAFPAEVAMIPSFLLLKQLSLLNTFAALILPGMANGYSIFLLKGFFDSLPKELYEAGIIDGASEGRMFWQITVPLSKPVLAVIALSSFTAAYGNFMFAFLVCQNPKMWTIMVWLYELQIGSPSYVVMAALTLAAIPTLLVFVFCQNIIMRGIILPSFK